MFASDYLLRHLSFNDVRHQDLAALRLRQPEDFKSSTKLNQMLGDKTHMSIEKINELKTAANSQFLHGDYRSAINSLINARFLDPSDSDVLYGLAILYWKAGDLSKSEQTWRNYALKFPEKYSDQTRILHAETLIDAELYKDAQIALKPISYWSKHMPEKEKVIQRLYAQKQANDCRPKKTESQNMYASKIYLDNIKLREKYMSAIKNTDTVAKLNYSSVIVVTYGRTGSTLLQGLLNTINGVAVLGENDNAFYHLYMYQKTIKEASLRHNGEAPNGPFYGCSMPRHELTAEAIRNVINAYFYSAKTITGAHCIGFKEVKYYQIGSNLIEYLDFLDQNFPNPLFIFLSRAHHEIVQSGWWSDMCPQEVLEQVSAVETTARNFAQQRKNTYFIDYNDVVKENKNLRNLFHKIGATYNAQRARVIFDTPHSYNPSRTSVKNIFSGYGE